MSSTPTMSDPSCPAVPSELGLIAGRYRAHEVLGRGGMAHVYRVSDLVSGQELALKQLRSAEQLKRAGDLTALFQSEFYTLTQLRHPRVIEVYDYGIDSERGPYYTMELLDGADLRERSPLPWSQVCKLLFDVCSSLALLHSRRLLHRDVNPRNIRCTRKGTAKLIDFGAMAPMGSGTGPTLGTPPFIAPELLQRSTLDARSDLFAVGATLYYALTRQFAYRARTFDELLAAWRIKPAPPSQLVPGIPTALDELVMSLLSLEPELRPHSSFEVMQRLAAIGGFECDESINVSRGYLATPTLVGRESELLEVRRLIGDSVGGKGGGLLIRGDSGLGRSRMLDACALEAKALGATVLRAAMFGDVTQPFSVVRGLLEHALFTFSTNGHAEIATQLTTLKTGTADPDEVQRGLAHLLVALSKHKPLVIVIDDVEHIDAQSAAFVASLVALAARNKLLLALTTETRADGTLWPTIGVIARRCEQLQLQPLSRTDSMALLSSVFGDVPNLHLVGREIGNLARGNPRELMDLTQHLVDTDVIHYAGGRWTVPNQLRPSALPGSAAAAIAARIALLSPRARFLAEAHALSFYETFTRESYQALCKDVAGAEVDRAISELLSRQVLASDGRTYTFGNRVWTSALTARLSESETRAHHARLAELYEASSNAGVHHLFAAGLDERGLDGILERVVELSRQPDLQSALGGNAYKLGPSFVRALEVAHALGRSPRQLFDLRRWLVSLSVLDARYYADTAPAYLEQLMQDSGLALWRADTQTPAAADRLSTALRVTHERYLALPEDQRVYRFDEAIRGLVELVVVSVAVGARTMDSALLASLPELIEPFTALSPLAAAIWHNALGAREATCKCRYVSARARWRGVLEQLNQVSAAEQQHVPAVRNALVYGIAVCETVLGLPSAADSAARLDHDPMHRVSALYLRKIVQLEQGDIYGAQRLQRQAEVLELQTGSQQMFSSLVALELSAHAQARDLVGVKEVMQRIEPLAAAYPGWVPYRHLAKARFELIRGDFLQAELAFTRCIQLTEPDTEGHSFLLPAWVSANGGLVETLCSQGRFEQARSHGRLALERCTALGIEVQTHELVRLCALADAKLGNNDSAVASLTAVIEQQLELGVSGLKLGLSYEMRAQVALWAGDANAFQHYARLTAREYRHAAHSPLAARYERLMTEAHRSGYDELPALADFESGNSSTERSSGVPPESADLPLTAWDRAARKRAANGN